MSTDFEKRLLKERMYIDRVKTPESEKSYQKRRQNRRSSSCEHFTLIIQKVHGHLYKIFFKSQRDYLCFSQLGKPCFQMYSSYLLFPSA